MTKLYTIPRNSFIKIKDINRVFLFHHIDGAYSLCTTLEGGTVYLPAYSDVEIVDKPDNWGNKSE